MGHILIVEGRYVPKSKPKDNKEFQVGQLIRYSPKMPFPMNHLKIGLIVEKVDIEDYLKKLEENPEEYIDKGFMEEWTFYIKLREALMIPPTSNEYIEERERLLDRVLTPDSLASVYLYRVLWNNGVEYIEHPEDMVLYDIQDDINKGGVEE